ncbi:hypothetical protein QFC19_008838 [Naganishia cerealis]|uniref:Uncharacterized protein n=1 Tax=Naganishia cerealis TaxID=610337 RepID=A0ACC2UYA9_9TREE|nr:hypothetical protein QFC19_008838 [Naganishia cerealis]
MTELVPDQVKATYQALAGKAGEALSDMAPDTAASLAQFTSFLDLSGQKPPIDEDHRNSRPKERHSRHPAAPKNLEEFIATQLVGKIDNDKLAKQFPAKEGVWHGFIDVSYRLLEA